MAAPRSPDSPRIEVVYALPDRQRLVVLPLQAAMTARQAVDASGILQEFPEVLAQPLELGIFGRLVEPERLLRDGDRVEIYRPLRNDPRDARRRLAAQASGTNPPGRGR